MMDDIEEEIEKFDAAANSNKGKIIPTIRFVGLDIEYEPNIASIDDIIKPEMKKKIILPDITTTTKRKNNEMF